MEDCLNHGLIGLRGFHGLKASDEWHRRFERLGLEKKEGRAEGRKREDEKSGGARFSQVGGNSDSRQRISRIRVAQLVASVI